MKDVVFYNKKRCGILQLAAHFPSSLVARLYVKAYKS